MYTFHDETFSIALRSEREIRGVAELDKLGEWVDRTVIDQRAVEPRGQACCEFDVLSR